MTKSPFCPFVFVLSLPFASHTALAQPVVTAFSYQSYVCGTGQSTGGNFRLAGSIGQNSAGDEMNGGNFELTSGFWAGIPAYGTAIPTDVTEIIGRYESGQVGDLAKSDDTRLCYSRGNAFAPNFPAIWLEIEGNLKTETPQALIVSVESQVNDFGIDQEIFLYNFDLNRFDSIDVRPATVNTDGSAHVYLLTEADAAPYVESGTGSVLAKITYTDSGTGFFANWRVCIDQFIWKYR